MATIHKTVRVAPKFTERGARPKTGEDDLEIRHGKLLTSGINDDIKKLRSKENNLDSSIKKLFGHSVDHPQGGIASLSPAEDETDKIKRLVDVMKTACEIEKETRRVSKLISDYIATDEYKEKLKKLGFNPDTMKDPYIDFGITIAINRSNTTAEEITELLSKNGVLPSSLRIVSMVQGQDEKLLSIMENVALKLGEAHRKLKAKATKAKLNGKDPITKEDIICANHDFARSLDDEREKIRIILGEGTPQMEQVDALIDRLLNNGEVMIDVFRDLKLSTGEHLEDSVSVNHAIYKPYGTTKEMLSSLGCTAANMADVI